MKKNIHPKSNLIIFLDNINKNKFLVNSTLETNKKININNINFKLKDIEISSELKNK